MVGPLTQLTTDNGLLTTNHPMKLYRTSEYWLVEHANTVVRLSRFDVDAWLDA